MVGTVFNGVPTTYASVADDNGTDALTINDNTGTGGALQGMQVVLITVAAWTRKNSPGS